MTDTVRTLTALQALYADNTSRAISEQDLRDGFYSTLGVCPYVAKTTAYTATQDDEFIAVDASGGSRTITLPAVASTRVGKRFVIKKTDSSGNAVVADGNASETIDGATTVSLSTQYHAVVIVNTGSAWLIQSKYTP